MHKEEIAMPWEEAQAFVESVPWRAVKGTPEGPANKPPDPHEYVIRGWQEVDRDEFDALVRLVRARGYRGRYSPPYDPERMMTNTYLEIGDHIYWFIYPKMLNRQLAAARQHEITSGAGASDEDQAALSRAN